MRGPLMDDSFIREPSIPLTKAPIRAIVTSLLQPLHGSVLGEVGTGSGGITAELARQVGPGKVFSLDPSERALDLASRNLSKMGLTDRVTLICGKAPEHLASLPPLDGLTIGGHGGRLTSIIRAGLSKLKENGRIIVTANMPSTADEALKALESLSIEPSMWQLAPSEGRRTKAGWMLKAWNPTFIVWGDRKGNCL